jgi:type I restriction enzyme S subunit
LKTIDGWETKRFDEFGTIFSGSTPSTSVGSFWDGEIVWITPYDLSRLNSPYLNDSSKRITEKGLNGCSAHLLPAGSLVMSSRAPIGYVALPTVPFCTNQGCKSIKLKSAFHSEFAYYNVLFNIDKVKNLGEGTTFAEISKAALSTVELAFPESLSEQAKIAEILSTVDRAIEQTEALIAKQQRIENSLMRDLVTRGIDEDGKLRKPVSHNFKPSSLGEIPVDWNCEVLGDKVELCHGYQFRDFDFVEDGIPVVKIGQVTDAGLDLSRCSFVSEERQPEFKDICIKNGDVLMALTGATLGKVCVAETRGDVLLQNYRVGRFEPREPGTVHKGFLFLLLRYHEVRKQIFERVNAGAQGNVGKADFERVLVCLPPFNEQAAVAQIMETSNNQLQQMHMQHSKLLKMKDGLMQDLLSGNKRVTPLLELEPTR